MQTVRGYNLNLETPENIAGFAGELLEYHGSGKIRIMLEEFPLDKAAAAHEAIEGRRTMGKVVQKVEH